MSFSLAIIIEQLQHYGGSEIYLLECLRRWQRELDIVVYTTCFSRSLLREFEIDESKVRLSLLDQPERHTDLIGLLEDLVVKPKLWENQIGKHDLYFQYLFPTQMVQRSPSIWFAAEPLRMVYDLRHYKQAGQIEVPFHIYPRMEYGLASADLLSARSWTAGHACTVLGGRIGQRRCDSFPQATGGWTKST